KLTIAVIAPGIERAAADPRRRGDTVRAVALIPATSWLARAGLLLAVAEHGDGKTMQATGRDRYHARGEALHLHRHVAVRVAAVAELAGEVGAPGPHGAI